METITITKRIIDGRVICNKKFDDYDKGYYGERISLDEYNRSKSENPEAEDMGTSKALHIVERMRYSN